MWNKLLPYLLCGSWSVFGVTLTSESVSWTAVSNTVFAANAGDVIQLPSGSAVWAGALTVTQQCTIRGMGTNLTIIIQTNAPLIIRSNEVRICNICFSNIGNSTSFGSSVVVYGATSAGDGTPIKWFRVDRCLFVNGGRVVSPMRYVQGVVDHNVFVNCNIAVGIIGDNNKSWERPIVPGTTNCVVIEDNLFVVNDNTISEPNEAIYHQEGARSTVRFNVFSYESYAAGNSQLYDTHGNQNRETNNSTAFRGQPIVECYSNTFSIGNCYRGANLRGGSVLWYGNTSTLVSGSGALNMQDEDAWQTLYFDPLDTEWPAQDGITNSFFWSNTINGAPQVPSIVSNSVNVIALDRDYWLEAPNATNGAPAGVYASYTPLTYPHPLVKAQDGLIVRVHKLTAGSVKLP